MEVLFGEAESTVERSVLLSLIFAMSRYHGSMGWIGETAGVADQVNWRKIRITLIDPWFRRTD
jgi:hypothetical protein